jgi:hypothetical protein
MDYAQIAAMSSILDQSAPRQKIKFTAVQMPGKETGGFAKEVDPLGSNNKAPRLEGKEEDVEPIKVPPAVLANSIRVETPVIQIPSAQLSLQSTAPIEAPSISASLPQKSAVFVSDLMDLEVPCFEINLDKENGFLSLVIQGGLKLKLTASQKVQIRIDGVTDHYWFTGISVPATVFGITTIVFGKDSE